MIHEHLTDDNFIIYCAKRYDNPQALSTDEFLEDLDRIKYIKKLLTKYAESGDLRERLVLNHIMILQNCFGSEISKILFLKLEKQFKYIKPFLIFLNICPTRIYKVGIYDVVNTDDISLDDKVVEKLRKMNNESRNQ